MILLLSNNAFATAQFGDRLIYKGETVSIFSNPLESFFNEKNPRPNRLFRASCSACWRGYVATWKIEDETLYLIKLVQGTCGSDAKEIQISRVFPERNAPVKATWFTGTLRVPRGKRLSYVHMGYGSIFEKDLYLTFEKGKLTGEHLVDNTKKELPTRHERALEELQKLKEWEENRVKQKDK
ncbi:hypothetical protein ACFL9T_19180 [Thermodesulfobacteriota bacterium]